ncbi:MAG: sensor domain-containing protein [Acidimicrobiia bacterium]
MAVLRSRETTRRWCLIARDACWACALRGASLSTVWSKRTRRADGRLLVPASVSDVVAATLELMPDAIFAVDDDGVIVYASRRAEDLFGYAPRSLVDREVEQLVPQRLREGHADHRRVYNAERRVRAMGSGPDLWGVRADGVEFPVEISLSPMSTPDGFLALVAVRDVSQRYLQSQDLRRLAAIVEDCEDAIFSKTIDGIITSCNGAAARMHGYSTEEVIGQPLSMLVPKERHGELFERLERLRRGELYDRYETVHVRKDGSQFPVSVTGSPVRDGTGAVVGSSMIARDISARREAERALHESEERFRRLFADAPIGMAAIDVSASRRGRMLAVNREFGRIADRSEETLLDETVLELLDPADQHLIVDAYAELTTGRAATLRFEARVRRVRDQVVWVRVAVSVVCDDQGTPTLVIAQVEDISARKEAEDRLTHLALHDELTGLPNRMLVLDRLRQAQARGPRRNGHVAVLFVDLDHFKLVNDSLGHHAGDELLRVVAERLVGAVRPSDTVARFGGDEFVVCCDDLGPTPAAAEAQTIEIAERIQRGLMPTVRLGDEDVRVAASIGITVSHAANQPPEELLRDADAAMYRAKERGRGRFEMFDLALQERALQRMETEIGLRRALADDAFVLHYQPIVDLATGHCRAVEALLRWADPDRGLVPPGEFLTVAEETGLIVPIGEWVLRRACQDRASWTDRNDDLVVAVNVSALQLSRSDLASTVREALDQARLPARVLELEVTESVLMNPSHSALSQLDEIEALGVRLTLDDFGTGYASVTSLRTLAFHQVKIDRSFVAGIPDQTQDTLIVDAIVRLARGLGLEVVAEGVETAEQADTLRAMGCQLAQGCYFSPPMAVPFLDLTDRESHAKESLA